MRKPVQVDSSQISDMARVRIRSVSGCLSTIPKLRVELSCQICSDRVVVVLHYLQQVGVYRRVEFQLHFLRGRFAISVSNCPSVITFDGSSSISRSLLRASSISASSMKSSGNDSQRRSASFARSFSGRLKANFSTSAITDIFIF